jgi:crotonobetainyl-CoA:carnitine CoA-transferase CaiB-like acyl-CoA transferase
VPETQPLSGIRVVDFSTMIAGPYATRLLADLGADVIKIESPEGDHMRNLRPRKSGSSRFFGQLNVGKRSVVLNLRDSEQVSDALALVATADVVVENWRPGVAARLGLAYDDCRGAKADIVYCSISGWGQTGPNAQRPAYAPTIHAASGIEMVNMTYQPDADRPQVSGVYTGDVFGGLTGFSAVLAALRKRDLTGKSSYVDVSLIESMLTVPIYEFQDEFSDVPDHRPSHRPVPTKDGFIMVMVVNDPGWRAVSQAIGRPELATDPRFSDVKARTANWDEIHELVCAWAAELTVDEAEGRMLECGAPAARYHTMASILQERHLIDRETFREVNDPAGDFIIPATPFRLDGTVTPAVGSHAPGLGEDSAAVLGELDQH